MEKTTIDVQYMNKMSKKNENSSSINTILDNQKNLIPSKPRKRRNIRLYIYIHTHTQNPLKDYS